MQRIVFHLLFLLTTFQLFSQEEIKVVSGFEDEIYNQFAIDINNNIEGNIKIYSSKGSIDNINKLITDSIHMAFMQYDVLLNQEIKTPGVKEFVKIFLPLYNEEIHLITKNNTKINTLKDLNNKRVGVGTEYAGSSVTAKFIKLKTKLNWVEYKIPYNKALKALIADSIDAFFFVGAAPSNVLSSLPKEISGLIKLVPIEDKRLDDIYIKHTIESKIYPWQNHDVNTYSVKSVLVVNEKNLNMELDASLEALQNDLKENLRGIQKNKFSHPKWDEVDFSDLKNIDWPVYKKEFISMKKVINWLAYFAAILTFIQIYFIINKLWKRKHERVVAESISISAMFISIVINGLFIVKNIRDGGYPQLAANVFWVTASVISATIGIGFWVAGRRQKGFWTMFKSALSLERQEAGDLAKAFFRPSGAEKIINILGQIAMIDDDLDKKEKDFIEPFAEAWGIKIDWKYIKENFGSKRGDGFQFLRESMKEYLETSPPEAQVSQLHDVINGLIHADDQVTQEEELIADELSGQIAGYMKGESDYAIFKVAVVPQDPQQDVSVKTLLKDLEKTEIAGGFAYLSEPFYSEKFAEIVAERYRSFNVFTVVIRPEQILATSEIIKGSIKKSK